MFFVPLLGALLAQASPAPAPTASPNPCASISAIVSRPSISTSVCAAQPRTIEVESGWSNAVNTGSAPSATVSYPSALVRVGTGTDTVDIEAMLPSFERSTAGGVVTSGYGDISIGVKTLLGANSRTLWGGGLYLALPTGSDAFTSHGPGYTGQFNWSYALSPTLSLGGSLNATNLAGTDASGSLRRYSAIAPSIYLSNAFPGATSLFAEYAYVTSAGPGFGGKSTVDGGITHDLSPNVQIDLAYGAQLNAVGGTKTTILTAGLSFIAGRP